MLCKRCNLKIEPLDRHPIEECVGVLRYSLAALTDAATFIATAAMVREGQPSLDQWEEFEAQIERHGSALTVAELMVEYKGVRRDS